VARRRRNRDSADAKQTQQPAQEAIAADAATQQHDAKLQRFRLWVGVIVFQAVFGGSIFVLTKAHYEHPPPRNLAANQQTATPGVAGASTPAPRSPRSPAPMTPAPPLPVSAFPSNDPVVLKSRANDQFLARDYNGAVATYEKLNAVEPDNPDTLNNLGLVLHYVKRSDAAIASLERAVALSPNHQRSWLTMGFVRKALGQRAAAKAAFEQVLAIDSNASIASEARRMMAELD
tara:strand:- start:503 stop:1201 length:699 start_codon:yes stop_codon:yes gene_type:complete